MALFAYISWGWCCPLAFCFCFWSVQRPLLLLNVRQGNVFRSKLKYQRSVKWLLYKTSPLMTILLIFWAEFFFPQTCESMICVDYDLPKLKWCTDEGCWILHFLQFIVRRIVLSIGLTFQIGARLNEKGSKISGAREDSLTHPLYFKNWDAPASAL